MLPQPPLAERLLRRIKPHLAHPRRPHPPPIRTAPPPAAAAPGRAANKLRLHLDTLVLHVAHKLLAQPPAGARHVGGKKLDAALQRHGAPQNQRHLLVVLVVRRLGGEREAEQVDEEVHGVVRADEGAVVEGADDAGLDGCVGVC